MKKSYHSIVVPIEEAAATFVSEVFLGSADGFGDCGAVPPAGRFVAVKTTPSLVGRRVGALARDVFPDE